LSGRCSIGRGFSGRAAEDHQRRLFARPAEANLDGLAGSKARNRKHEFVFASDRAAGDGLDDVSDPESGGPRGGARRERGDAHAVADVVAEDSERRVAGLDPVVDCAALAHPLAPPELDLSKRLAERALDRGGASRVVLVGRHHRAVEVLELPFACEILEHRAHLRIVPLRVLHEVVRGERRQRAPLAGRAGEDLPAREVEADVRVELHAAVPAERVVLIQARQPLLHPDGVRLPEALHVGVMHEMHELMLEALAGVAGHEATFAVQVHAADLGSIEVAGGVGGTHDRNQRALIGRLPEVRLDEVPLKPLERLLHPRMRGLVEKRRVRDAGVRVDLVAIRVAVRILPTREWVGGGGARASRSGLRGLARLDALPSLHDVRVDAAIADRIEVRVRLEVIEVVEALADARKQLRLGFLEPPELRQHARVVVEQRRIVRVDLEPLRDELVRLDVVACAQDGVDPLERGRLDRRRRRRHRVGGAVGADHGQRCHRHRQRAWNRVEGRARMTRWQRSSS
jgi:hypothetical protein